MINDIADKDFEFELVDFDFKDDIDGFDFDTAIESSAIDTQLTTIKRYPRPKTVKYEYAVDMVKGMSQIQDGESIYGIVSGNFIFGDFIEAFMVENNFLAEQIFIATLSMSQGNVDSLKNLQQGDYVKELGLIVSDYWYAHERRKDGGVPYIIDNLSDGNFRFAAAALHTKIAMIKTDSGDHYVFHGSANLRSSRNIEQFMAENNRELYSFNALWMEKILDNFSATKQSTRGGKLWQTVQQV